MERFYDEAINRRDRTACHRLLKEDFRHNGVVRGRDGQAAVVNAFLDGISDLTNEILITVVDGDMVAAHQRWTGKHDGPFMGFAPTGARIDFTSTAVLRLEGELIAEAWDVIDLALLSQLQAQAAHRD